MNAERASDAPAPRAPRDWAPLAGSAPQGPTAERLPVATQIAGDSDPAASYVPADEAAQPKAPEPGRWKPRADAGRISEWSITEAADASASRVRGTPHTRASRPQAARTTVFEARLTEAEAAAQDMSGRAAAPAPPEERAASPAPQREPEADHPLEPSDHEIRYILEGNRLFASAPHTAAPRPAPPRPTSPLLPAHPGIDDFMEPARVAAKPAEVVVAVPGRVDQGRRQDDIEVRVTQRAGEVHVAVRTRDAEMAQSMRDDLGDLVARLDNAGYKADVWQPAEAAPSSRAGADNQAPGRDGGRNGNDGAQRQDGGDANDQRRQQGERQDWAEELERSIGKNASRSLFNDNKRS